MTRTRSWRRFLPLVGIALAFLIGFALRGGGPASEASGPGAGRAAAAQPAVWTCSMHPQVRLPEPGQCPICFMDLIPLDTGADADEGPRILTMTPAAMALAEVRTVPVARRPVDAAVRLVGTVRPDETRTRTIAARIAGRLDTLFVDFTGMEVRAGDPLASLYSPELLTAQTELLGAIAAEAATARSASALVREATAGTAAAARRRLSLWGLEADQIAAVERRGRPSDHLRIRAPLGGVVLHKNVVEGVYVAAGTPLYTVADLSRVWIELEAYEADLPWLETGQEVAFTTRALPGQPRTAKVVFIDPVVAPDTRTAQVRLEADNADGRLKPGMFVSAAVAAAAGGADAPLVIPVSAPLVTGKRAVVYVQLPDRDRPTFEGRVVALGPRAGDWYVVRSGLVAGEQVVVNGNFKIDSALQIQAKPSMMTPEGAAGGAAPAATGPDRTGSAAAAAGVPQVAAPAAFRDDLDAALARYLEVQAALAADDDATAGRAAAALAAAVAAVDADVLPPGARGAWQADRGRLEATARDLAAAGDIAGRRRALEPVSHALWRALAAYGTPRPGPVRLFHCPMAHDNSGADWLQLEATTANPYFGAAMLRCGSQTDSLTTVAKEQ